MQDRDASSGSRHSGAEARVTLAWGGFDIIRRRKQSVPVYMFNVVLPPVPWLTRRRPMSAAKSTALLTSDVTKPEPWSRAASRCNEGQGCWFRSANGAFRVGRGAAVVLATLYEPPLLPKRCQRALPRITRTVQTQRFRSHTMLPASRHHRQRRAEGGLEQTLKRFTCISPLFSSPPPPPVGPDVPSTVLVFIEIFWKSVAVWRVGVADTWLVGQLRFSCDVPTSPHQSRPALFNAPGNILLGAALCSRSTADATHARLHASSAENVVLRSLCFFVLMVPCASSPNTRDPGPEGRTLSDFIYFFSLPLPGSLPSLPNLSTGALFPTQDEKGRGRITTEEERKG